MAQSAEQRVQRDLTVQQIERCLSGDAEAWQELVESQHRRVYFLCYNFTKSQSDAEDLTQDVFLKLFCNLSSFDVERGSFQHWLQNITRNHLVDHFRRNRVARATESLDVSFDGEENGPSLADRLADAGPTQEQWMTRLEVKARVHAALEKLSANSREAVIFCDLQELNYREAAEILRVPEGTVKSRLSRGRAELARLLAPARKVRGNARLSLGVGSRSKQVETVVRQSVGRGLLRGGMNVPQVA